MFSDGQREPALPSFSPSRRAPSPIERRANPGVASGAVSLLDDPRLDHKLLEEIGFDRQRFESARDALKSGALTDKSSLVTKPLDPPPGVVDVPFEGPEADRLRKIGEAALRKGEIAVVVLNGGMATRFGNVVKGTVEVFDGKSFIGLKAAHVAKARAKYGAPVPLVLMNSFATDAATKEHLAKHENYGLPAADLLTFTQSISIRMTPDGELFIGADGKPSYYAPGHGDFFHSIRASGILKSLAARGVTTLLFSNVDNLGATVEPIIIGQHLALAAQMSAEVTAKRRTASGDWDKGGSPAVLDGRVQIVEGFRIPADLAPTHLPDFSTNNFVFDLKAIDRDVPLGWHLVKKKVDDRPAVQLESIACEASAVNDAEGAPLFKLGLLRVPRDGDHGRFFPVKERVDLEEMREILKKRLASEI